MTNRRISRLVPATATPEGKGVTVYRTIAAQGFSHLDPFLLLDEFVFLMLDRPTGTDCFSRFHAEFLVLFSD